MIFLNYHKVIIIICYDVVILMPNVYLFCATPKSLLFFFLVERGKMHSVMMGGCVIIFSVCDCCCCCLLFDGCFFARHFWKHFIEKRIESRRYVLPFQRSDCNDKLLYDSMNEAQKAFVGELGRLRGIWEVSGRLWGGLK